MAATSQQATALAQVRSSEKRARAKLQKRTNETPDAMPHFVTMPEFVVMLMILIITDILDILLVLGLIGVGKIITIVIDIVLVLIVFTWSYFRLHQLPPERLSHVAARGKWKGKMFAVTLGELIPLLGLVPWWTIWLIGVYRGQRKLKKELAEQQYSYA